MCQITRYHLCTDMPGQQPPPEKVDRCKGWGLLRSRVLAGDHQAREQFRIHMEGKLLVAFGVLALIPSGAHVYSQQPERLMASI